MIGAQAEVLDILGLIDPGEASQAELEALERISWSPREKKRKKRVIAKGPPRDELGRFTRLKKGKNATAAH